MSHNKHNPFVLHASVKPVLFGGGHGGIPNGEKPSNKHLLRVCPGLVR